MKKEFLALKYTVTLAGKIIRYQKKRNLIMFSVISTSIIFAFVSQIVYFATQQSIFANNLRAVGTMAEGIFYNISKEQMDIVKTQPIFSDSSYCIQLGQGRPADDPKEDYPLLYAEEKALAWGFVSLTEGSWPHNEKEIVLEEKMMENEKIELCVGDSISLSISTAAGTAEEEFIISGLCTSRQYQTNIYVSEAFAAKYTEDKTNGTLYCRFPYNSNAEQKMQTAAESMGTDIGEIMFLANPAYADSETGLTRLFTVVTVVGIIILFTFVTVYSIFNITVIGEIKTYSNLELIGVTQSQIQLLVFLQAFIVYLISIPVGLGIGWAAGVIGLHMANYKEIGNITNHIIPFPACGRNAILLALLVVVFSVRKPIRFIRRISPVEASGFSDVFLVQRKQRKPKKYSLTDMAVRNVLRFKGRNTYIIILYSLSMALFMGITSYVKSISLEKYMSQRQLPADIVVGTDDFVNRSMMTAGNSRSNSPNELEGEIWSFRSQVLQELKNACGNARIEPYYYHYDMNINEDMKKRFLQVVSDPAFRWEEDTEIYLLGKRLQEKGIEDSSIYLTDMRYFTEYEALERYKIVEGALDRSKFESGDYVVLIRSPYLGETGTLYHAGEKLVLSNWPDGIITERRENNSPRYQGNKDKEYTVLAVVEDVPVLYAQLDVPVACILPVENLEQYSNNDAPKLFAVALWGEPVEELEEKVAAVLKKNAEKLHYISYKSIKKELKKDVNQLAYIGYMIVLIGAALAFVNMQNSLQMGIVERKQEFRILRNLGMTGKQLLHMIHLENLILLAVGISGGLLAGIIGSNLLVRKFCDNYYFFDYKTAVLPSILLSAGFIFLSIIYPNKKTVL